MGELVWLSNRHRDEWKFDSEYRLILGNPKTTEAYSAEDLKRMGMVGVYRAANDTAFGPAWTADNIDSAATPGARWQQKDD